MAAWAEKAYAAREPATIEMVVAQQPGLAFNRRFHMKDGSVQFNPGVGNPNIVRPAGPVDTDLPVLLFRHADQGRDAIASLTTFAMHTTVRGGTEFSGDFPAVLQSRLRQKLGPDYISLFAEGTAGDINLIDVTETNQLLGRQEVERIGETLAATIVRELGNTKPVQTPDLAVASRTAFAPFQPVDEARYHESLHRLRDQKELRIPFLTLVAAWRDCHRFRYSQLFDGKKPLEVQAIRLNSDTAIVTLPHEVFVEIGLAIKATSPFRNTVVWPLPSSAAFLFALHGRSWLAREFTKRSGQKAGRAGGLRQYPKEQRPHCTARLQHDCRRRSTVRCPCFFEWRTVLNANGVSAPQGSLVTVHAL